LRRYNELNEKRDNTVEKNITDEKSLHKEEVLEKETQSATN
jgi:hypothetical protein